MKYIYLCAQSSRKTTGHGSSTMVTELSTYGGYDEIRYPAFSSEQEALDFMDKVCNFKYERSITRVPLHNS